MSADGNIVRTVLTSEKRFADDARAALAALARLEAAAGAREPHFLIAQKADQRAREAETQRDALAEALRKIITEAQEHWAEVDDLDDTGAHVGVAAHERAAASGKSVCADIARAALAEAGL